MRIVPAELWAAVEKRAAAVRRAYLRDANGQLWGRPDMGRASRHLLSGLGRCAVCGGNLLATGLQWGSGPTRRSVKYYMCSYHNRRGAAVCSNAAKEPMDALDEAVLRAVEATVLRPEAVEFIIETALAGIQERLRAAPGKSRALERDIRRLRTELERFLALIASGEAPPSVLTEIAAREAKISTLEAELAATHVPTAATERDWREIRKMLRARVGQFSEALRAEVPLARQALRKLLAGPLLVRPVTHPDGRRGP